MARNPERDEAARLQRRIDRAEAAADLLGRAVDVMKGNALDLTASPLPVQVEIDYRRGVLYVHMDGVTVLRVCRIRELELIEHGPLQSIRQPWTCGPDAKCKGVEPI